MPNQNPNQQIARQSLDGQKGCCRPIDHPFALILVLRASPTLSVIICLLLGIISVGCNDKERNTLSEQVGVTFEKLDSIQIYYLGNPTVHDLDPITRTVLFMEHEEFTEEIMVADFEGNIRASFSKVGDKPDSYGGLMSTLRIDGDSSFIA